MLIDRDEDIRRRAREIWESEGRPDGRELAHWEQAKAELENAVSPAIGGQGESIPLGLGVTDIPANKEVLRTKEDVKPKARSAKR